MDKRVLVIGATGLVGSALMRILERMDISVLGTFYSQGDNSYQYMNLASIPSIDSILNVFHPNEIYIAGAISDVDRCEIEPEKTYGANVGAIRHLVKYSNNTNTRLIFFSSSYVFNGNQERPYTIYDSPMPLNSYGLQKLLAEKEILNGCDRNIVVRTVGVFGKEEARKNFGYRVVDNILAGRLVRVPTDQLMNPILSDDLASLTVKAVESDYRGLLHIAGQECLSKFDFAVDIARTFDLPEQSIVQSTHNKGKALRPVNGCLQNSFMTDCNYLESLERFSHDF